VDDLIKGDAPVWVVVTRDDPEIDRPFLREEDCESLAPLRICRAVLADGSLVIGTVDPDQDESMSDLLLVDDCGEA